MKGGWRTGEKEGRGEDGRTEGGKEGVQANIRRSVARPGPRFAGRARAPAVSGTEQ